MFQMYEIGEPDEIGTAENLQTGREHGLIWSYYFGDDEVLDDDEAGLDRVAYEAFLLEPAFEDGMEFAR